MTLNTEDSSTQTPEQFRSIYTSAIILARLAPWDWMDDTQVFGVEDPLTGIIGWCVVLGGSEQVFGLNVFMGDRGYSHLMEIMAGGMSTNPNLAVEMDALVLHYNDKKETSDEEALAFRDAASAKRLMVGGRRRWPWARRFEPWRYPRAVTEEECRFLSEVVGQVYDVARRLAAKPDMKLSCRDGRLLVRVRHGRDGDAWIDSWESPGIWVRSTVEASPDADRLQGILGQSKRSTDIWEVDTFPLSALVQEAGAIYYPRAVLVMNKTSRMILHAGVLKPEERNWNPVMDTILESMERNGSVPSVLRVRNADLYSILKPLRATLGIRVRQVDSMPLMDSAARELSASIGVRHPR